MESKFVALELAGSKVEWVKNLLAKILLGIKLTQSMLRYCDSRSTIVVAKKKT